MLLTSAAPMQACTVSVTMQAWTLRRPVVLYYSFPLADTLHSNPSRSTLDVADGTTLRQRQAKGHGSGGRKQYCG